MKKVIKFSDKTKKMPEVVVNIFYLHSYELTDN